MGVRDTYKFEIGPGYAVYKKNENHPELAHIWDKKMPVGSLLFFLSKSGVNIYIKHRHFNIYIVLIIMFKYRST